MDKQFDKHDESPAGGIARREALKTLSVGLAGGLLASSGIGRAQAAAKPGPAIGSSTAGYLLVGSYGNNCILRYDEQTGAFIDKFDPRNQADLHSPDGGVFGPDHNLYVTSDIFSNDPRVLRYNGATGASQGVFAGPNVTSPRGLLFGHDGNLYVANGNTEASGDPASVLRFDGKTGAFLGWFVAPNSGGLEHPTFMVFGPDGDLYLCAGHACTILRYDGTTGASKGVFVTAGSGGLSGPFGIVFGADGDLYVASANWFESPNGPRFKGTFPPGSVLRYQGPAGPSPGAFIDNFVPGGSGGLANPSGLLFGPNGDLFVASCVQDNKLQAEAMSQVLRFDGTTGAFMGVFVAPGSGGLKSPTFLMFTETNPTTLNYGGP